MTAPRRIIVGSRMSPLAAVQTNEVLDILRRQRPDMRFVVVPITSEGDLKHTAPLLSMERGMFVKEIETALLEGEIDLAVHSAKDLPADLPDGLRIGAFAARKDARDVLVNRWGQTLKEIPAGARLGTSSPRRSAQIRAYRPDVDVVPIRGNVGTRLDKVTGGQYDGVVLAAAGIQRLRRQEEISEYLSTDVCVPEVGQGALALEVRSDDNSVEEVLSLVDHEPTRTAVVAERVFLRTMGGGCKVPVSAYAWLIDRNLHISTVAATPDGTRLFRTQMQESAANPEETGRRAALELLDSGAEHIVERETR